jgi:putative peptidoglycan lipid II flippase
MLSRVLGLVREQLFAILLGATRMADAFIVAFRIPNLLRDLFAEGALSQAFVPTFKASLKKDGKDSAFALGNRVAGTVLLVIGTIVLLAEIFAPQVCMVLANDFRDVPEKFELTVSLTRVMLPFLGLVSLAAVAMGMLNAQDRYAAPALAPAMFNVLSIAVGACLYALHVQGHWVVIGWAVGTILGGMAQLLIQLPPLWRAGWRPRLGLDLRLRDPNVRRVALLMAPAIAGVAAVQLNVFINTMFATSEAGATAWLNYAFRFLQLPIGVFGVAIGTVSTTRFSDAAADEDHRALTDHLTEGLRLVAFLTVPATVGLILLGEPIIRLIYEHGRFKYADTLATVAALDLFAVGLVAYAAVKVIAPAFYATNQSRVAVYASLTAVGGNVLSNLLLHPHYGYKVLALGTAIAAILNFAVLYVNFHRRIHAIDHLSLLRYLIRIGLAATVMGVAVWTVYAVLVRELGQYGLIPRLAGALVPVTIGGLVYAGACAVLRVEELKPFMRRLRRRRG